MRTRQTGFTLIETAIVLVIVGLLLGVIIRGQALIDAARVRNLATQEDDIKAAFLGFQDRYRALPGDFAAAATDIDCGATACLDGDGNGRIEAPNQAGLHEEILAWSHLTAAGFVNANYRMANSGVTAPDETNTPKSACGTYVALSYDSDWGAAANTLAKHNLKTGNQTPVEVLAELDRKVDDGLPYSGSLQFSAYTASGLDAPDTAACVSAGHWSIHGGESNCGATRLLD